MSHRPAQHVERLQGREHDAGQRHDRDRGAGDEVRGDRSVDVVVSPDPGARADPEARAEAGSQGSDQRPPGRVSTAVPAPLARPAPLERRGARGRAAGRDSGRSRSTAAATTIAGQRPEPPLSASIARRTASASGVPSGPAPIVRRMTLCFIEPAEAIRVMAESIGREARRALLAGGDRGLGRRHPRARAGPALREGGQRPRSRGPLDARGLARHARGRHAGRERRVPGRRVRRARRPQARRAEAGGPLPGRRGLPRRRRRGGGARHRAAVAVRRSALERSAPRRSRSTSTTASAATTSARSRPSARTGPAPSSRPAR